MTATLPGLIERQLARQPDAVALIEGERHITYAEFDALCARTSAWLAARGIGAGDRIAVWLVNRIEWLALLFGAARLGAAVLPLNTRYRGGEVAQLLESSGARLLVLQREFRGIDFPGLLREADPAAARSLESVALLDTAAPEPILGKPTHAFDAWQAAPGRGAHDAPDALAALFSTSGTTRGPKLVMHPQRSIAAHSQAVARSCGFGEPGARLLSALPLAGVFGFNAALGALGAGATVVLMQTFEPAAAVELIRRHAVTHLFGSDEMYRRMLELAPGYDPFPSARVFGYAAFHPGGAEFARAAWARRVPLTGLYGSSEVQALFALQPPDAPLERRIEAGGRPAAAEAEVRVRDADSGELLPPGRSGEIEIRAPGNFTGYWNDPEASAAAIRADGFFRTGDIGQLRADGGFLYETRRGDALRLAGYLVGPPEIEDALKRLPGVADVQVVGLEIGGQPRCAAFVIPAVPAPRAADLIAAASRQMAAYKVPARVWFVDHFPATESANGVKIQRAQLRAMALERLRADPLP